MEPRRPPSRKPLSEGRLRADLASAGLEPAAVQHLVRALMAAYEGIVAVSGLGRTSVTLDCPDGTVTTIKLDVWEGEGTYLVHRQHRRELSLFDEPTL